MGRHNDIQPSVERTDKEAAAMSESMTRVGQRLTIPPLPSLDGPPVDLQTLRGKKVLLFMWGSW